MKPRDLPYLIRAKRGGARYARVLIEEARREDVPLSLAFAICEQETGFANIFGHDPTIFVGAGRVTRGKYFAYRRQRRPNGRGGMQGVGPMQLTYFSIQDEADHEGGCWKPRFNIRVGLRTLRANIRQHGQHEGIARYNGTGDAAERYARQVEGRQGRWHAILTGKKR
jgi:hypothetical protein